MLRKYLLIGVGGSGGTTIRYLWRELDRKLKARGWEGGVPDAWRFLHIDVTQEPDVIKSDVPMRIGRSARYLGLARFPHGYQDYDDELCANPELLPAVGGWRPDPTFEYASPYKGAGQRRVVGRIVTLAELDKVGDEISASVAALADNAVTNQLDELNRHLKLSGVQTNQAPGSVAVFSSLGGGAGSGAFLDVIQLLMARATDAEWLGESLTTVLYAADVFGHIPMEGRGGLPANSLAALCELLSAYEHKGPVSELESRLLHRGGGTLSIEGRRCGRPNFIIGAGNDSISFGHSLDVFRSVAKAYATFMTDKDVQREFIGYCDTNFSAKAMPDFKLSDPTAEDQPCSSFGYANVSLGRGLFADYAAERIAKRAIERLLRGHYERETRPRREEDLIAEQAENAKHAFFEASGLYELGADQNQVLDALRDAEKKGQRLDEVMRASLASTKRGKEKASPAEWFKHLTSTFNDLARDYEAEERAERSANAQRWVSEVQARLLEATAARVGLHGIAVTLELVDLLDKQLHEAADELDGYVANANRKHDELLGGIRGLFESGAKVVNRAFGGIDTAASRRRDALSRSTEAELYDFTAALLRDAASSALPPLRQALRSLQANLSKAELDSHREVIAQWSADSVPPHLMAAPNELMVDDESSFPETLDGLLMEGAGGVAVVEANTTAIREVVSGAWPSITDDEDADPGQSLIEVDSDWQPAVPQARRSDATVASPQFQIDLDPDSLLLAAERWVKTRRGPVARHVGQSLGSWLSGRGPDAAARADRFADYIKQAITNAAPLVSVNAKTYKSVHVEDLGRPTLVVSPIPVGPKHRSRAPIEAVLRAAGVEEGEVGKWFNANSPAGEVEVASFMRQSVHPIVFDSVMSPIHRDWHTRTSPEARTKFWRFRRARTLPAFVPLEPSRQEQLVRGWLAALLLGHVEQLRGRWSAKPLTVWTPRGSKSLPRYLLGDEVTDHGSVLPALLESLPLAMLDYANDDPEELAAYSHLIDLGVGGNPLDLLAGDGVEASLADWILHGRTAKAQSGFKAAPEPVQKIAGSPAMAPAERAATMAATVRAYWDAYTPLAESEVTLETTLTLGRGWEIRDLVRRATKDLADAIERLPTQAAPSPGPLGGTPTN